MCHTHVPFGTLYNTGELLMYYVSLRGPGWSSTYASSCRSSNRSLGYSPVIMCSLLPQL
jgi:hypothetical protein